MGTISKQIFDLITTKAGFNGRIKLTTMTGMTYDHAASMEDDPQVLAKLKRAATEILGTDVNDLL